MAIDWQALNKLIEAACCYYEKSAPTVSRYLDDLYARLGESDETVTVPELLFVESLNDADTWMHPNQAANRHYKLMHRLGRETVGMAGY